jgi:hypothetical protein
LFPAGKTVITIGATQCTIAVVGADGSIEERDGIVSGSFGYTGLEEGTASKVGAAGKLAVKIGGSSASVAKVGANSVTTEKQL